MEGLDVLLQDFGEISRKAFEYKKRGTEIKADDFEEHLMHSVNLYGIRFFDKDGIVWYDGREGFMPEEPIGKPEDYLTIRDDFDELKAFIGKTLDRGRVHAGGGTHCDTSRETNCADYIAWLHQNNSNQDFRRAVERATSELLAEEFEREYAPRDFEGALKRATDEFNEAHHKGDITQVFFDQDINTTRWRYGVDRQDTPEDREFREWYDRELEPTIRPEPNRNGELCTHFAETSPEFKEALKQRLLRRNAASDATRDFSPQFNRLIGLLDVVSAIGEHDARFAETYSLLRQKAEDRFMIDAPTIKHHYSDSDIYQCVLVTLASVQQGTDLEGFWLDNVRDDKKRERVIASIHGLMTMYDAKEERRGLISPLLGMLRERGFNVDVSYRRDSAIGYTEENTLDDITGYITDLCFDRDTYHHLDRESASLDFLQSREIGKGSYAFRFKRYDPSGTRDLSVSFDLASDSLEGEVGLEASVRAYLRKKGYELPNAVWVTSLEGRRISGTDAKVVMLDGQDMDGIYEGIVGLNHTHFPFIYADTTGNILVAGPIDSMTVFFGVRGGWEGRRIGLEKVSPIGPSQFMSMSRLGERIDGMVAEKKKAGYLGDALYGLKGKLTDDISPYLGSVVGGRLVWQSDGLVG